jgi:L-fucose/D-arabinose isomerase
MAQELQLSKINPHRLKTPLPKIGIRPIIDGRYGGVRESLEGFTMALAAKCAELISSELRYVCGLPAECVVANRCIGGAAEAAACAAQFEREGVGVSLSVTPCWCYGAETMDMSPLLPKAIWGFNGSDRPGAVYLAATLSGHAQKGLPCFGIYGRDVQDLGDLTIPVDVREKILRFARGGLAVAQMRSNSYLAMGGVSMGIAGSMVDANFFESWLGMRVETIDMSEFTGRMQSGLYDAQEFDRAMTWVKKNCREGKDLNSAEKQRTRSQKDEDWATSVKMALIARDLMVGNEKLEEMGFPEQAWGHNAIAAGFQGQRQWTDYFPNGDFMEAILCSSFDWNGNRQPYMFATENDSLNGASMLLGNLLTNTAQMFSDVRTYWSPEAIKRVTGVLPKGDAEGGVLHLINSGPSPLDFTGQQSLDGNPVCKPFWEITESEANACLENTLWCASDLGYFKGGGWSTDFLTKGGMPCTMFRVNLVKGLGPVLQIAEGTTAHLPENVHDTLDARTNPTWPSTWFVPRTTGHGVFRDVYTVMNNWGANHGAISYGHIGADLIALASMLRIPVDMHNVPGEDIFRPAVWSRFGTADSEGSDYRACASYGPLYARLKSV